MYPLIEPSELNSLLNTNTENLMILDGSCASAIQGLSPYQSYQHSHIKGAKHFDIDDIADQSAALPHTVPSADYFAEKVSKLGVNNNQRIIVYDQKGMAFAASRVWWLFRLFGHENVQILNGGLPAWQAEGFETVQGPDITENQDNGTFTSHFRPHLLKMMDDVLKDTQNEECLILDARAPERFSGSVAESRSFVGSGHIPSSKNQFFMDLIDSRTGKLKEKDALKKILEPYTAHESITCTCGGGVTACTLALGLFIIGYEKASIYDGSWAEWGNTANKLPIQKST